jgi:hypothetical protein
MGGKNGIVLSTLNGFTMITLVQGVGSFHLFPLFVLL